MNLDPTGTHPDSYTDSHNAYTSAVGSRFACANARRFESGDAALDNDGTMLSPAHEDGDWL